MLQMLVNCVFNIVSNNDDDGDDDDDKDDEDVDDNDDKEEPDKEGGRPLCVSLLPVSSSSYSCYTATYC